MYNKIYAWIKIEYTQSLCIMQFCMSGV